MTDSRRATGSDAPSVVGHIAVDLGKTNCRVRVVDRGATHEFVGAGAPGFASEDGATRAFEAIASVLDRVPPAALTGVVTIGIGAAGGDSDDDGVRRIAALIHSRWGWEAAIASDVVSAHIGAFSGGPGTILIAGTGAVAGHLSGDGTWSRSDGWGPWLGDEGSGQWIGRQGLIAALRSADRRGPYTALEVDARAIAPDLRLMPQRIAGGPDVARSLASFAPTVLARARDDDPLATRIVADAVRHLVDAARAVTPSGGPVSVVGGLSEDSAFAAALSAGLAVAGLTHHRPDGSPLDGAALLALRNDLPHERFTIRDAALEPH
jgi:glucosamine kinase